MEGLPIVMVGVVVCCEGDRLGAVGGGCGLWCGVFFLPLLLKQIGNPLWPYNP